MKSLYFIFLSNRCFYFLLHGEGDDTIIAVWADDLEYHNYNDIRELSRHRLTEIKRFFEDCIFSFNTFLYTNIIESD